MGTSITTVEKMMALLNQKNASYDKFPIYITTFDSVFTTGVVSTIQNFCQIYFNEAVVEGVRVEVAFALAMSKNILVTIWW
jgi:hypothetical protein